MMNTITIGTKPKQNYDKFIEKKNNEEEIRKMIEKFEMEKVYNMITKK
jgi:hypothetical protein